MRKQLPIGKSINLLTIIGVSHQRSHRGEFCYVCRCSCGVVAVVASYVLKKGIQRSCGCMQRAARGHGLGFSDEGEVSPELKAFYTAKSRCSNSADRAYAHYGGRGIEFRFHSFEEFYEHIGAKPTPDHSLDRIDNDGHYEPGNVRWATLIEQGSNKRNNRKLTINGETRTVTVWARESPVSLACILSRKKRGMCDKCAVFLPRALTNHVDKRCVHKNALCNTKVAKENR